MMGYISYGCHLLGRLYIALRDTVTLLLLKLCSYIADVTEWSRALDIRHSYWADSLFKEYVKFLNMSCDITWLRAVFA
jgi:hypothetical protein